MILPISQTIVKDQIKFWNSYSTKDRTIEDLNVANRKINHFTKLLKPILGIK